MRGIYNKRFRQRTEVQNIEDNSNKTRLVILTTKISWIFFFCKSKQSPFLLVYRIRWTEWKFGEFCVWESLHLGRQLVTTYEVFSNDLFMYWLSHWVFLSGYPLGSKDRSSVFVEIVLKVEGVRRCILLYDWKEIPPFSWM